MPQPPRKISRLISGRVGESLFAEKRRAITWRSLVVGLLGVIFICGLTPFNDFVARNTNLIGSFLPLGLLLFFLLLVLVVNAPLSRFVPRHALRPPELAVALGMMLVSCTLPSAGLMRYLPGHLTAIWQDADESPQSLELLEQLNLPTWLFPTMTETSPELRGSDPVVTELVGRVVTDNASDGFVKRAEAAPWRAWLVPALTWGLFFAFLYGTVICLMVIFRRQWVQNERLPFPLASIYLSVIEAPPPGNAFNALFSSRGFWIAFGAVFLVHLNNGLSFYDSQRFPQIPLGYALYSIFANPPFVYLEEFVKEQTIYFTIIGLSFFVSLRVSFSLWSIFLISQLVRMTLGSYSAQITYPMQTDQQLGSVFSVAMVALWIARGHLAGVGRQMLVPLVRPRDEDPVGRYLPYQLAGWGVVLGVIGMVAWLVMAGMSLMGASLLVTLLMMMYLVLARTVAETGLPYVMLPTLFDRPWVWASNLSPNFGQTTLNTHFFNNFFHGLLTYDTREALPAYASHALRVADGVNIGEDRRRGRLFVACLALALVVGFITSGGSYLACDYAYQATLDQSAESPINSWGASRMPAEVAMGSTKAWLPPKTGPQDLHSGPLHFGFGAVVTFVLGVLRLRLQWWPFYPVGFLLVYTWGLKVIWFSIFLGWAVKALVLRLGGPRLLRSATPIFLGLILGEAGAAAFWLVVSLVRLSMGLDYHAVQLLPV